VSDPVSNSVLKNPQRQLSQYVLSIPSTLIAPGETKSVFVETTQPFRLERLLIPEPPRSRTEIIVDYLRYFPLIFLANVLALFSEDGRCPGWKSPLYFPMSITNIKIGTIDQLRPDCPVPAEIFRPEALDPQLRFGACEINQRVTVTVKSLAGRPFLFRSAIVGIPIKKACLSGSHTPQNRQEGLKCLKTRSC